MTPVGRLRPESAVASATIQSSLAHCRLGFLALTVSILAACSTGYVEDNGFEPREYVPPVEPPTPAEIDRMFEEDLDEIESELGLDDVECVDVTSYDYDWSNDMLCTRADGTTFHTDYEGARAFLEGE
jgi:hypothetical protein